MRALLTASERLQRIEVASPEVTELARAASLSVRIEPELLRRLRLALFPRSGAWLEADLYFSALVAQRTLDWIVLDPVFTPLLLESLTSRLQGARSEQQTVYAMRMAIERAHLQLPFELRQEEDILWLTVERSGSDQDVEAAIDAKLRLLLPKLLQSQSPEQALATARWFASAARRLPPIARATEAFSLLAFASSSILGGRAIVNQLEASPQAFSELSRYLPASAKRVHLWVALTTRGVHISFTELPGHQKLDVPHTDPILLDVMSGSESTLLHIVPGKAFFAPRRPDDVSIRTVARDLFQLRAIPVRPSSRDAVREFSPTPSREAVPPRIFIIYRRDDAPVDAGKLYDSLVRRFSKDRVFMDTESIAPGEDFREAIEREVRSSAVVLVVIGRNWLRVGEDQASGRRRIDDPSDFVRLGLMAALSADIPIIPVLVQGAGIPGMAHLPAELLPLANRNALELSPTNWENQIQKLTDAIEHHIGGSAEPPPKTDTSARPPHVFAGFKYDCYISYAQVDDRPVSTNQGWVSQFDSFLSNMLESRLGRRVRLFRDTKLSGTDIFSDVVLDVLRNTVLFIAVISPSYLQSEWCRRELSEFSKTAEEIGGLTVSVLGKETSRVLRVTKIPTDENQLPEILKRTIGYQFYEQTEEGIPLEIDPQNTSNFQERMSRLAFDIAEVLKSLGPQQETDYRETASI